jgi:hypothetical protein
LHLGRCTGSITGQHEQQCGHKGTRKERTGCHCTAPVTCCRRFKAS